jgi:hypothetical protein
VLLAQLSATLIAMSSVIVTVITTFVTAVLTRTHNAHDGRVVNTVKACEFAQFQSPGFNIGNRKIREFTPCLHA